MSRRWGGHGSGGGWRAGVYPLAGLVVLALGLGQVLSEPATPRLWLTVLGCVVAAGCAALLGTALLPAVLVVVGVDVAVQFGSGAPPFATFLATMLGVYALTRRGSRREMAIGFAVLAAGIGSMAATQIGSGADSAFGVVIISVYIAVAAGLGWWTRQRAAYTRLVQESAEALRRERDQAAALAAAAERGRLARELHDVVSHGVSLMVLQAEAAGEVLTSHPAKAAAGLDAVAETGRRAIADLRQMLGLLVASGPASAQGPAVQGPAVQGPAVQAPAAQGPAARGEGDLATLVSGMRHTGLTVELDEAGSSDDLPDAVRTAVYRVVQESLTNVVKHARATTVRVAVTHDALRTTVDVTDDGSARSSTTLPGHGLAGMSRRVEDLGGTLDAGRLEEGGFAVHAQIPTGPAT
jgi:signal transduction histidine kinase